MQITDKGMNAKPTDSDQWLIESLGRGAGAFVGRITPTGTRSFYFRYTGPNSQQVRLLIDRYDRDEKSGTTLAKARKLAGEWSLLYKGEGNAKPGIRDLRGHFTQIHEDKKAAFLAHREQEELNRQAAIDAAEQATLEKQRCLSVKQVFERWAASELAPHVGGDGKRIGRKDGGQYVRDQFERRVFPVLGAIAAVEVRKADILAILDAVKAEGKLRTANMLLADLKQMFRFAAEREIIEHSPIELINKRKVGGKDIKRARVLSNAELHALVKQLAASGLNRRTAVGLWLILSTGCRIGELMGSVWADATPQQQSLEGVLKKHNEKQQSGTLHLGLVDLTAHTLYFPDTKNQRDHLIHLSDFALKQFAELLQLREVDQVTGKPQAWVFPNSLGTGPVCIKSFGKQLADRQRVTPTRMKNRTKSVDALKLEGGRWTAHDLRRTTSTIMSQLGISNDVINECLNHIKQGMSGVYIQDRRIAEQVIAFNSLGARLNHIVTGEELA